MASSPFKIKNMKKKTKRNYARQLKCRAAERFRKKPAGC